MKRISSMILSILFTVCLVGCREPVEGVTNEKPVIYLYPEIETEVSVTLAFAGELTVTYPKYKDGWHMIAQPDGTLTDVTTGHEYSYLFWEGIIDTEYDMSEGFVVSGEDTVDFLRETLAQMGMTPREYNDFIVYWLPRMQANPYNLITFQKDAYTDTAALKITPQPDSILRVFMVWKALDAPIEIQEPALDTFHRQGFTVVEWGGAEIQ